MEQKKEEVLKDTKNNTVNPAQQGKPEEKKENAATPKQQHDVAGCATTPSASASGTKEDHEKCGDKETSKQPMPSMDKKPTSEQTQQNLGN